MRWWGETHLEEAAVGQDFVAFSLLEKVRLNSLFLFTPPPPFPDFSMNINPLPLTLSLSFYCSPYPLLYLSSYSHKILKQGCSLKFFLQIIQSYRIWGKPCANPCQWPSLFLQSRHPSHTEREGERVGGNRVTRDYVRRLRYAQAGERKRTLGHLGLGAGLKGMMKKMDAQKRGPRRDNKLSLVITYIHTHWDYLSSGFEQPGQRLCRVAPAHLIRILHKCICIFRRCMHISVTINSIYIYMCLWKEKIFNIPADIHLLSFIFCVCNPPILQ